MEIKNRSNDFSLHPKHSKLLRREGLVQRSGDAQGEDLVRVDEGDVSY